MKKCLVILLCILFLCGCTDYRPAQQTIVPEMEAPADVPEPPASDDVIAAVAMPTPTPEPELPTLPPTPSPTPEPTPEPTPTPTPTPEPTKDPNRLMVALTFDDGPNMNCTMPVLDKLEQYHVKATFYVLGSAINDKNGYMLQRMVDLGCEIGVHGRNHDNMTTFTASQNAKRMLATCDEISSWIEGGYRPTTVRPPGGSYNGSVLRGAKEAGLAVVKWSVDTADWKTQNAGKIMEVVKKKTQNGSIILCHDRHKPTVDALDQIIPWLLEQGYELVTVTELLTSTGEPLEAGKLYTKKDVGD